jgi:hypothetical protein
MLWSVTIHEKKESTLLECIYKYVYTYSCLNTHIFICMYIFINIDIYDYSYVCIHRLCYG